MRACRIILHPDGTLFCLVTALRKDRKYLADGPGLYRSRDGARTWEWIEPVPAPPLAQGLRRRSARQPGHLPRCRGCRQGGRRPVQDDRRRSQLVPRRAERVATVSAQGPSAQAGLDLSLYRRRGRRARSLAESGRGQELEGPGWHAVPQCPAQFTFDPRDDAIIYVSTFGGSVWHRAGGRSRARCQLRTRGGYGHVSTAEAHCLGRCYYRHWPSRSSQRRIRGS